ncbi:MAG: GAF domain-containing protein, partial [Chloroflexi bacterium]|nr:GAF domain-containing protein [Chloroflexota bacterium]
MEMMERAGAIVDRALAGEALTEVYAAFARLAVDSTGGDAAWVLLDRDDERFVASYVDGRDDERDDAYGGGPRPVPGFLRGAELETRLARRPLLRNEGGPTPYVTAPVRLGAEHLGCLVLAFGEGAPEDADTRALGGLAALVAVA